MDILIIRPGALGDTLMALPALMDLKGKAAVTFVGRRPGVECLEKHVQRTLDIEQSGWHRLFQTKPDGLGLPASKADVVIAFLKDREGSIRSNLEASFPDASVHLFPSLPEHGEKKHVALYFSECLNRAGLPIMPQKAFNRAGAGLLGASEKKPREADRIVFHPGSGSRKKNHPYPFWLKLMKALSFHEDLNALKCVCVLGPAEASLAPAFVEGLQSLPVRIIQTPNMDRLYSHLTRAEWYLGHDSGITHLAAMLGTRTIAFFKQSDPFQWRPLGPHVRVFERQEADSDLIERVIRVIRGSGILSCHRSANSL